MSSTASLHPEIEFAIERARSGASALRLAERRLLSHYDPARDAEAAADRILKRADAQAAAALVLIGAGLGELPRRLRARSQLPLLVWEPFPGVQCQVSDRKTQLEATHPEEFDEALAAVLAPGSLCSLAVHPGYEDLTRFEQRYALRALRRRSGAQGPRAWVTSRRSLESVGRLSGLRPLASLGQLLDGRTAIIASGGPSLDAALPALRERSGGVLLAAPQALARLLQHRVRVDYVVNPDPADLLSPVLEPRASPFAALLADTASHPAVLDRCPERTFLFHLRSPQVHQLAWQAAGLPVVDEPLVSVSDTAFWLARELGARRFLLLGADFASPTRDYGAPFSARAVSGGACQTNPLYFQAARSLSHAISECQEPFEVRRLSAGVEVPGAREIEADELASWLCPETPPPPPPPPASDPRLVDAVRGLLAAGLPPLSQSANHPKADPWLDFAPLAEPEAALAWSELTRASGA